MAVVTCSINEVTAPGIQQVEIPECEGLPSLESFSSEAPQPEFSSSSSSSSTEICNFDVCNPVDTSGDVQWYLSGTAPEFPFPFVPVSSTPCYYIQITSQGNAKITPELIEFGPYPTVSAATAALNSLSLYTPVAPCEIGASLKAPDTCTILDPFGFGIGGECTIPTDDGPPPISAAPISGASGPAFTTLPANKVFQFDINTFTYTYSYDEPSTPEPVDCEFEKTIDVPNVDIVEKTCFCGTELLPFGQVCCGGAAISYQGQCCGYEGIAGTGTPMDVSELCCEGEILETGEVCCENGALEEDSCCDYTEEMTLDFMSQILVPNGLEITGDDVCCNGGQGAVVVPRDECCEYDDGTSNPESPSGFNLPYGDNDACCDTTADGEQSMNTSSQECCEEGDTGVEVVATGDCCDYQGGLNGMYRIPEGHVLTGFDDPVCCESQVTGEGVVVNEDECCTRVAEDTSVKDGLVPSITEGCCQTTAEVSGEVLFDRATEACCRDTDTGNAVSALTECCDYQEDLDSGYKYYTSGIGILESGEVCCGPDAEGGYSGRRPVATIGSIIGSTTSSQITDVTECCGNSEAPEKAHIPSGERLTGTIECCETEASTTAGKHGETFDSSEDVCCEGTDIVPLNNGGEDWLQDCCNIDNEVDINTGFSVPTGETKSLLRGDEDFCCGDGSGVESEVLVPENQCCLLSSATVEFGVNDEAYFYNTNIPLASSQTSQFDGQFCCAGFLSENVDDECCLAFGWGGVGSVSPIQDVNSCCNKEDDNWKTYPLEGEFIVNMAGVTVGSPNCLGNCDSSGGEQGTSRCCETTEGERPYWDHIDSCCYVVTEEAVIPGV